ncbi:MAG: permease [Gemmataceae bacterium]
MDFSDLIRDFSAIIYEALPFIVLGVVIAGFLEEFVPQQAMAKVIPSNRFLGIMLGGLLGIVFPMCECGIIVVMRRLLRKGLPLSICAAYMLAGPIINVVVILSTYVAFDPGKGNEQFAIYGGPLNVVLLRCGLGYLVAIVTACMVEAMWRKQGLDLLHPKVASGLRKQDATDDEAPVDKGRWLDRFNRISATALNDFVEIMTFLVLGAAIAMIGRVVVHQADIGDILKGSPAISILLMMAVAVLFCLCSEADAFVAANFDKSAQAAAIGASGGGMFLPPAAKIAFLVLGPMMDLKLYLMYTRMFRPKLIFMIILFVATQVFVYCMALHYLPILLGWQS